MRRLIEVVGHDVDDSTLTRIRERIEAAGEPVADVRRTGTGRAVFVTVELVDGVDVEGESDVRRIILEAIEEPSPAAVFEQIDRLSAELEQLRAQVTQEPTP